MHRVPICLAASIVCLASAPQQDKILRDFSKRQVELPIEQALPVTSLTESRSASPGLVRWHADHDAALAAAARSGKPVLLFQLLGRLDQEFC